ncbi:hypothetical protein PSQ40_04740 [Curvibacter sp. HBC61]|uniref:GIY-YIG domain-containing protein n=1 Tax=Curvibacter cyanobacteriorum TaxID=3026422 RepID=A0ABT5MVK1_9BURK|nr:hypothetical protein [Curvibacter sp. HBC61]MDD0837872.1 hypothetical protein [Curvibacter sp. HBC61]
MNPIQIIDVIKHKNAYGYQWFVVVDRMPKRVYTRTGNMLVSNDSGFYDFLAIEGGTKAFGGRKFSIQLDDGSTFECHGQVWSCGAPKGTEPTVQLGIGTIERLRDCYVFSGASVSKARLQEWLDANEPSTDYRKYDRRETEEYWLEVLEACPSLKKQVSAQRARALKRRGVLIFKDGSARFWSPYFERKKAHKAKRTAEAAQ